MTRGTRWMGGYWRNGVYNGGVQHPFPLATCRFGHEGTRPRSEFKGFHRTR